MAGTLTQYEAVCPTEPHYSRGTAAGIFRRMRELQQLGYTTTIWRDEVLTFYNPRVVELNAGGWLTRNPTLPLTSAGITGP